MRGLKVRVGPTRAPEQWLACAVDRLTVGCGGPEIDLLRRREPVDGVALDGRDPHLPLRWPVECLSIMHARFGRRLSFKREW